MFSFLLFFLLFWIEYVQIWMENKKRVICYLKNKYTKYAFNSLFFIVLLKLTYNWFYTPFFVVFFFFVISIHKQSQTTKKQDIFFACNNYSCFFLSRHHAIDYDGITAITNSI